MSKQKFLEEAQKCKEADKKERAKALIEKAKISKRKRVADDDSTSNLNLSQKKQESNKEASEKQQFHHKQWSCLKMRIVQGIRSSRACVQVPLHKSV